MIVWRIAKKNYATDLSGKGAELNGGRWNSVGIPIVYAGLNVEICAFELLVHTGDILPDDLMLTRITLPDDAALYDEPSIEQLPENWDENPSNQLAKKYGDAFFTQGQYLGLILPSSIIPEAKNIIINPRHSEFSKVTSEIVRPFIFDSRLRT